MELEYKLDYGAPDMLRRKQDDNAPGRGVDIASAWVLYAAFILAAGALALL